MSQKEKFALYLTPEMKARLERRYTEDGSRSLTGFIENAINFYLDYLSANNAGMFLPASVQSYLDGRLDQLENRMSCLSWFVKLGKSCWNCPGRCGRRFASTPRRSR